MGCCEAELAQNRGTPIARGNYCKCSIILSTLPFSFRAAVERTNNETSDHNTVDVRCNAAPEQNRGSLRDVSSGAACRRLLVVDGHNKLVGIVSVDDIPAHFAEEFRCSGELLHGESPESLGTTHSHPK
jgi:CBS domain-containing protein